MRNDSSPLESANEDSEATFSNYQYSNDVVSIDSSEQEMSSSESSKKSILPKPPPPKAQQRNKLVYNDSSTTRYGVLHQEEKEDSIIHSHDQRAKTDRCSHSNYGVLGEEPFEESSFDSYFERKSSDDKFCNSYYDCGDSSENESANSPPVTNHRGSWKDSMRKYSKQTTTTVQRFWNSDHVFLYMALFICVLFGLVYFVFTWMKYGLQENNGATFNDDGTIKMSIAPSTVPILTPDDVLSSAITKGPSLSPTGEVSLVPSVMPTMLLTKNLSYEPSISPTAIKSEGPTSVPSIQPSFFPSQTASFEPTSFPSTSIRPSSFPSIHPTSTPTSTPSISALPSLSSLPSSAPSMKVCTCTPLHYNFKLDLDARCPLKISKNAGIESNAYCEYQTQRNHTNFNAIIVRELSIIEYDTNGSAIRALRKKSIMLDGESFIYESAGSIGETIGGLSGIMKALNEEGEFIMKFEVNFTNICEVLPFSVGNHLGFLHLTEMTEPNPENCYYEVSEAPSTPPSPTPTMVPSYVPSSHPSLHPSKELSDEPSSTPTSRPTMEPSSLPTLVPSSKPTLMPSSHPSVSPTVSLRWDMVGSTILGETNDGLLGKAVALSDDGMTMAITLPTVGKVFVYDKVDQDSWIKKNVTIEGPSSAQFGSVAISDNGLVVAVGGHYWDRTKGMVEVWEWHGETWNRIGSTIYGSRSQDALGVSISLSGDGKQLLIGARDYLSNDFRGSAKVMYYDGEEWIQRGSVIRGSSSGDALASQTESVSISRNGKYIAIGAYGADLVKVFKWDDDTNDWYHQGDIFHGGYHSFGSSVALSSGFNETIVMAVAAPKETNGSGEANGRIHYYEWNGMEWSQRPNSISLTDSIIMGYSVALSNNGNTTVVTSNKVAAVFDWDGDIWLQRGEYLVVTGGNPGMTQVKVDISGDGKTVIVGLPQDRDGSGEGDNRGQASCYEWRRPQQ